LSRRSSKDLCLALMHADSAKAVIQILSEEGYWDDLSVWRPFGDTENNFGSIGNQQSDAVAALVEKLINSIDSRLMGLAGLLGISNTSAECPQDMRQAIAKFIEHKNAPFSDRDGKIFYWDEKRIREESENISLFATGYAAKDGFPCLSIADKGEGQTPDKFPDTFMSLAKSNKMNTPYAQGKFNMGGTGAFQFCKGEGNAQIQLVVSARNPGLLGSDATSRDREWGFSIVRRVTREGMRSPMYEYLAPMPGKNVLSFASDNLGIFPSDDKDRPVAYKKTSNYGTLIKLYEYDSKFAKTNLTFAGSKGDSLKVKIEEALTESALPIQIADCRTHFKSGRDRRSFVDEILGSITTLGNLDRERKEIKLETPDPVAGVVTLQGSALPISVFVFKEDPESDRYNPKGIFFTINGQTHGNKPSNFFTRKKINLSYIKDSLFVTVDVTHLTPDVRSDLFMNSRDRMRQGANADELEAQIESFLGEEPTLQALNRKRQEERIKRSLEDQKPLEDTLKQLVKLNPKLAELLPFGIKIPTPAPGVGTGGTGASTFVGKQHPTFFRFKKNRSEIERSQPINQSARVEFETDAVNDYFSRKSLNGVFSVGIFESSGTPLKLDYRVGNLADGVMNCVIKFDDKVIKPGDKLEIHFTVNDETLLTPFVNIIRLTIDPAVIPGKPGTTGKDSTGTKSAGDDGGSKSAGLPSITPVEKAEWSREGFDELSSLKIKSNPDGGYDFFYNKDNKDLVGAQSLGKSDPKILDHQYKIGLMLVALSIIEASKRDLDSDDERVLSEETIDLEKAISEITQAMSPYWLTIIEALGGLSLKEYFPEES